MALCRPSNLDSGPGLRVCGAGLGPMATPSARPSVHAHVGRRLQPASSLPPWAPTPCQAALVPLTDISSATVPAALLEVVVRLLKKLWLRNVN